MYIDTNNKKVFIYNSSNTDTTDEMLRVGLCPYCSNKYDSVYHYGGICPKIKEIEYYKDGAVKRVILR